MSKYLLQSFLRQKHSDRSPRFRSKVKELRSKQASKQVNTYIYIFLFHLVSSSDLICQHTLVKRRRQSRLCFIAHHSTHDTHYLTLIAVFLLCCIIHLPLPLLLPSDIAATQKQSEVKQSILALTTTYQYTTTLGPYSPHGILLLKRLLIPRFESCQESTDLTLIC